MVLSVYFLSFQSIIWYNLCMMNLENNKQNKTEYINNLEETCKSQEAQIKLLENKIAWMMEQITLSKHVCFGSTSEKSEYDQVSLFDEAEKEADERIVEPEFEEIKIKRKKRLGKKDEMLSDLPVEVV